MNIFVLSEDPAEAAHWLVDRHCVSQLKESAQLLCSAFKTGEAPYKHTHHNHPCAKWVRLSTSNFRWLVDHGLAICAEYTTRYGRIHASEHVIKWCESNIGKLEFPNSHLTEFAQAMPEEYKNPCAITAYRNYYKFGKTHLHKWKQNKPWWI